MISCFCLRYEHCLSEDSPSSWIIYMPTNQATQHDEHIIHSPLALGSQDEYINKNNLKIKTKMKCSNKRNTNVKSITKKTWFKMESIFVMFIKGLNTLNISSDLRTNLCTMKQTPFCIVSEIIQQKPPQNGLLTRAWSVMPKLDAVNDD